MTETNLQEFEHRSREPRAQFVENSPRAPDALGQANAEASVDEAPFRFVHSHGFAELLQSLGASLVVTTYQAGKLVAFRAREGRVSMLLRSYGKAMGLAVRPDRIAVASEYQIWTLHNSPEVAAKMKPPGQHDGCFLPRSSHVTGNIDVHEIAWGRDRTVRSAPVFDPAETHTRSARVSDPAETPDRRSPGRNLRPTVDEVARSGDLATAAAGDLATAAAGDLGTAGVARSGDLATAGDAGGASGTRSDTPQLWVVNTLFSCLCTLEPDYSFVPRWRPRFISDIKRQGRCHLNGMALVDGLPKYVTAFGETDEPEGWRPGKVDGGVVIDVDSGETIARGLSMPHSPRVHDGRLWLLDSGRGRLVTIDPTNGRIETVAQFTGYARGLALCGPLAFVGLSQVRETAVFGGVPIAEGEQERPCGVSVVDTRTGQLVGFIEFEATVEELFDVQLLPGVRFPAVVGFNKDTIQRACVIAPEREMN